tara:strand:- start:280 stop:966 length:687 start_codon:yes stop_codon:yes gene_type:complete
MNDEIVSLYQPTSSTLHKQVIGTSGSGKSIFLEKTAESFLKSNNNKSFRLIYFSPKHEGFLDLLPKGQKPVSSVDEMIKSMSENTLTVFYPPVHDLDDVMDNTLDALFDMKDANDNLSATIIIDDAQTFLSSRKEASTAFRRIALLGRSKSLNVIFVAHQPVMNKTLEAQVEKLVFFSLPNPNQYKSTEERFGFDPSQYDEALKSKKYSFVIYEVGTGKTRLMNPLKL